MSLIKDVFTKKNKRVPIWLMRQAGRYLPEYQKIRSNFPSFLDLCFDVKNATEVTLQPINRFDLDAAIIFSDILVLPYLLGWGVSFKTGHGPILKRFESGSDLLLMSNRFSDLSNNVYEAISTTRLKLDNTKSLIGFAGSPWTVASYMLEGGSTRDFSISKRFLFNKKPELRGLIEYLSKYTAEHLVNQVKAGVDILQLFDSWSGVLFGEDYNEFIIKPTKYIVKEVKKFFPDIPIIGFPRGSGHNYDSYIRETGVDCVGVDQFVPIDRVEKWSKVIPVQGNLDPNILFSSKIVIKDYIDHILFELNGKNFIFNLGHGVLPKTPIENVKFLVDYVKNFKKDSDSTF